MWGVACVEGGEVVAGVFWWGGGACGEASGGVGGVCGGTGGCGLMFAVVGFFGWVLERRDWGVCSCVGGGGVVVRLWGGNWGGLLGVGEFRAWAFRTGDRCYGVLGAGLDGWMGGWGLWYDGSVSWVGWGVGIWRSDLGERVDVARSREVVDRLWVSIDWGWVEGVREGQVGVLRHLTRVHSWSFGKCSVHWVLGWEIACAVGVWELGLFGGVWRCWVGVGDEWWGDWGACRIYTRSGGDPTSVQDDMEDEEEVEVVFDETTNLLNSSITGASTYTAYPDVFKT
ncbi:hypothetical protein Tco_1044557 [Tanacetum coccineum]|uniref:Uncharacterized protein n=1 Tax=Tanacetum coccineum TaxID=301880 RepID=A0ABQ5GS74_9ASTR